MDLIDDNGGRLFDPHSVVELRRELDYILNCDAEKMGQYNYERVKHFSSDSVIRVMKQIYGIR